MTSNGLDHLDLSLPGNNLNLELNNGTKSLMESSTE